MQKSITSFFGAPKEGAGVPSSSPPKQPAASSKSSVKAKPKPKPEAKPIKGKVTGDSDTTQAASTPNGKSTAEGKGSSKESAEKRESPFKAGPAKRKVDTEETRNSSGIDSENGPVKDENGADPMDKEGDEGAGDGGGVPQPKRLRRLAEVAAAEDSDDDVFGGGEGDEEKIPAVTMDMDDDVAEKKTEDDVKAKSSTGKAKGMKTKKAVRATLEKAVAKSIGNVSANSKAAKETRAKGKGAVGGVNEKEKDGEAASREAEQEEEGEDDPDTAGEGEGSEEAEIDEAGDDDDGEELEEDDEEEGVKTVTSTLMEGAMKKPILAKRKAAAKAGGVTLERAEDLLAKASWKKGQPVPFEAVADVFNRVEQTSKRLEIQEILRGFLCQVISLTPEDLIPCVYLACNEVAPAYERLELGIGDAVLQKAIQGATGRSAKDVKAAAQKAGDLGEVAQHSTKAQGTLSFGQTVKTLSAKQILEEYRGIARVKGSLSQDEKIKRIKKMLVSCKGLQAKYIIRGLQGKMRIGLSVSTVMVSLSHAAVTCPSEAALAAEEAEKKLQQETAAHDKSDREKFGAKADSGEEDPSDVQDKDGGVAGEGEVGDGRDGQGKDAADAGEQGVPRDGKAVAGEADKGPAGHDDELIPAARRLREATDIDSRLELACQVVKQAYSECPNLDLLIRAILNSPLHRLQQICRLTPGVPVSPMLAKPTKSIGEVLQRLSGQEFTCEYKYDGVRAQVHLSPDGNLRFFSRSSKDSSSELPDLIPVMKDSVEEGVKSYVIDTEVVAYDRDTGNLLPFQMLSTRGRKDVDATDVKVKVIVEAFDILYLNGKSLLQSTLQERRQALRNTFKEVDGRFKFATFMDHKEDGDTGPIEEFLAEAVKGNCEGLMVKTLTANASYEPSKRSLNWLKLKKDYLQADGGGVGDSLDLVPIGAYLGRGKRTGKYGAYLLACYDPDREEYQSVCKIGTGFTDEVLLSFWTELKEYTMERRPRYYNVADSLAPDVWLEPKKVWEVKCADLSKSPVHKAAIGKAEPDRGISIRFPRLLRERDDKDPEQATTSDQVLDMYESQDVVKSNAVGSRANNNNDDDDWEL